MLGERGDSPLCDDAKPMDPMARRRLARLAGWAVSAGLLAVALLALRDRWDAVGGADRFPDPLPSAGAGVLFLIANAVLALTWRSVVRASGSDIAVRPALWVWAASQLARYSLSAAQIGGRAALGRRYGLTLTTGGATALVEIGWQTSISALLVLATLPWWLGAGGELTWLAWAGLLPASVLVAGLLAPARLLGLVTAVLGWGPLGRLTRGRLGDLGGRVTLSRAGAARLTLLYALNTGLRLGGFLLLFAAVGGDVVRDGMLAVGAASLGQLVGRLAVFSPGGLGPREGATALVVYRAIGGGPAAVLVAATRVIELVAELAFLAVAWVLRPRRHAMQGADPVAAP